MNISGGFTKTPTDTIMSPFADILSCKWVKKCWRCAVISSAVSTCLVGYMFWLRIKKKLQKGTLKRKKKKQKQKQKKEKKYSQWSQSLLFQFFVYLSACFSYISNSCIHKYTSKSVFVNRKLLLVSWRAESKNILQTNRGEKIKDRMSIYI